MNEENKMKKYKVYYERLFDTEKDFLPSTQLITVESENESKAEEVAEQEIYSKKQKEDFDNLNILNVEEVEKKKKKRTSKNTDLLRFKLYYSKMLELSKSAEHYCSSSEDEMDNTFHKIIREQWFFIEDKIAKFLDILYEHGYASYDVDTNEYKFKKFSWEEEKNNSKLEKKNENLCN